MPTPDAVSDLTRPWGHQLSNRPAPYVACRDFCFHFNAMIAPVLAADE